MPGSEAEVRLRFAATSTPPDLIITALPVLRRSLQEQLPDVPASARPRDDPPGVIIELRLPQPASRARQAEVTDLVYGAVYLVLAEQAVGRWTGRVVPLAA